MYPKHTWGPTHYHQANPLIKPCLSQIQTDDKKMSEDFKLSLLTRTAKLLIEIPYTYELYLSSSGSKAIVVVENIESDNIDIHAENNCFLSQLKSQSISVTSKTGKYINVHFVFMEPLYKLLGVKAL